MKKTARVFSVLFGAVCLMLLMSLPVFAAKITRTQVIGTWDGTYEGNWVNDNGELVDVNRHVTYSFNKCLSDGTVGGIVYVSPIHGEQYQVSGSYYFKGRVNFDNGYCKIEPTGKWKVRIADFNPSNFRGTFKIGDKQWNGYRSIGNWTETYYTFKVKKINNNTEVGRITALTLNRSSLTLKVGQSATINKTVTPNDLTGVTFKWKSSNSSIAKVSSAGKVTGVAPGSCTVTCTATYNGSSKSASCKVNVVAAERVQWTGTVTDAATGSTISGATVRFRQGENNRTGNVVAERTTNSQGRYSLMIPRGTYTIQVERTGYITTYSTVVCNRNVRDYSNTESISRRLNSNQWRVVLTWGESPRDLDSHMTGPAGNGTRFHVYYSNKNGYRSGTLVCNLDIDDTTSYGPETITLKGSSGTYIYSVHNYTNRYLNPSYHMAKSNAKVTVYRGNQMLKVYYMPKKVGTLWTVFKIQNGSLVTVNKMSYQSSPAEVKGTK